MDITQWVNIYCVSPACVVRVPAVYDTLSMWYRMPCSLDLEAHRLRWRLMCSSSDWDDGYPSYENCQQHHICWAIVPGSPHNLRSGSSLEVHDVMPIGQPLMRWDAWVLYSIDWFPMQVSVGCCSGLVVQELEYPTRARILHLPTPGLAPMKSTEKGDASSVVLSEPNPEPATNNFKRWQ
jgi:hypothetical protein